MNEPTRCEIKHDPGSSPPRRKSGASPSKTETSSIIASLVPWCFAPAIILCLFANCLAGTKRLAFRDVSHFYTPLYDYLGERNDEQWIPLWNPLDQTGMPVAGETTTAVFYPVRFVIYRLADGHQAMAWYVVTHLVLASLAMVIATKAVMAGNPSPDRSSDDKDPESPPAWIAPTVASSTYSLSGCVFSLSTNPPFLVSAAWLPLALCMMFGAPHLGWSKRLSIASASIAMMILGGDPQTALHVMMIAAFVVGVRSIKTLRTRKWGDRAHWGHPPGRPGRPGRPLRDQWLLLGITPLAAAVLASPQIAASLDWSRQSDRSGGTDQVEALEYSVPPWHFAELIAPNVSGTLLPIHARISSLIPSDGRMWTPTLFLGILSAWMILDRFLKWRRRTYDLYWMIGLLSALFAMGDFGFYGLLYHWIPGYDAFRYPAKWLPMFAFGCSVATGIWIQEFRHHESKRSAILLAVFIGMGVLVTFLPLSTFSSSDQALPRDEYWGPLDVVRGLAQARWSLAGSFIVLISIVAWMRSNSLVRPLGTMVLLWIVGLHWATSAHSILWSVDVAKEEALIRRFQNQPPDQSARWMRTRAESVWPSQWETSHDPQRLLDVEVSQRLSRFGRWHLEDRVGVFNNFVSIRGFEYARFWRVVRNMESSGEPLDWSSLRAWLGMTGRMEQVVVDRGESNGTHSTVRWIVDAKPEDSLRLATQWRIVGSSDQADTMMQRRLREISDGGAQADRVMLWIDSDSSEDIAPVASPAAIKKQFAVESKISGALQIQVTTSHPVAVVRSVLQDGNWNAKYRAMDGGTRDWQTLTVHPADFLKQAVVLPEGRWMVHFRYEPSWLRWTLGAAGMGWLAVAVVLIRSRGS